ncbi:MAG TPA: S8 family peptidase [Longimicrobium sp.]|uniref:S8 family peptidase n=1 Tax=Longimicrobium sp. TaxID=2029185 RepID=UPI002ED93C1A
MTKRTLTPLAVLVLAAAAACGDQSSMPTAAHDDGAAPLLSAAPGRGVDGSYIVVLNDGADPRSVAAVAGVSPRYVYTAALNGFAAELNAGQLNALQHNRSVEYIEANATVQASVIQTGATWGIDRIDQRALPLSGTFSYTGTGLGVRAYVIDTGIRFSHSEFAGRAVSGYDAVDGGTADDCNGHGTHVSGTVGGTLYGVAKAATLVGVRVLDCNGSGTNAGVIAGIDWVAANHTKPAVANMSLGGGASTAVDDAVNRLINTGVTVVVAAGNGNFFGIAQDACNYSPARVANAITIGATTSSDAKASYSNYGNCVDLFAPGSSIKSSWYNGDTATNTISGTSMATPHVVGVAALYLQANPGATPQQVRDALYNGSTKSVVTSAKSVNNHLLFTAF